MYVLFIRRGAFGSHVACVLRRLLRICAYYGSHPQFICCSATVANPIEHTCKLLPIHCMGGADTLVLIDAKCDGSPHGDRVFAIWNPPMKEMQTPSMGFKKPHSTGATASDIYSSLDASDLMELKSVSQLQVPTTTANSPCLGSQQEPQHQRSLYEDDIDRVQEHASIRELQKLQRFYDGCADRPETFGTAGEGRISHFQGGWNKRRKLSEWKSHANSATDDGVDIKADKLETPAQKSSPSATTVVAPTAVASKGDSRQRGAQNHNQMTDATTVTKAAAVVKEEAWVPERVSSITETARLFSSLVG